MARRRGLGLGLSCLAGLAASALLALVVLLLAQFGTAGSPVLARPGDDAAGRWAGRQVAAATPSAAEVTPLAPATSTASDTPSGTPVSSPNPTRESAQTPPATVSSAPTATPRPSATPSPPDTNVSPGTQVPLGTQVPPTPPPVGDPLACGLPNAAWTVPGRLLRGGRPDAEVLACLAREGVHVILDQRTPQEAGDSAAEWAAQAGLEYINLGIPDDTAPGPAVLQAWLVTVNDRLAQGKVVLVHDAAGRGRMGFWDAVYLMAHGGYTPQRAIDERYVGTALPFTGAKIDCANGGRGQVQALAEIAAALTGSAYYPSTDKYGNRWENCPRPAYMDGWDYGAIFGR